jgi:hypothetical protein
MRVAGMHAVNRRRRMIPPGAIPTPGQPEFRPSGSERRGTGSAVRWPTAGRRKPARPRSESRSLYVLTLDVPGRFLLVDHSISRAMDKGALGILEAAGPEQPQIFKVLTGGAQGRGGH